jgi:hypothetical protein
VEGSAEAGGNNSVISPQLQLQIEVCWQARTMLCQQKIDTATSCEGWQWELHCISNVQGRTLVSVDLNLRAELQFVADDQLIPAACCRSQRMTCCSRFLAHC